MTPFIAERTLKISLLRRAKERLQRGLNYSICTALYDSYDSVASRLADLTVDEMTTYIMEALSPAHYYESWLYKQGFNEAYVETARLQGRLAWIDWMIACYEEDIANAKKGKP